jgi:hypothetical protein
VDEAARQTAHMARRMKIKSRAELLEKLRLPENLRMDAVALAEGVRRDADAHGDREALGEAQAWLSVARQRR